MESRNRRVFVAQILKMPMPGTTKQCPLCLWKETTEADAAFAKAKELGVYELIPALVRMYNLQESIPLFGFLLTGPIFASGKVPIPKTMESIIDNCPISNFRICSIFG